MLIITVSPSGDAASPAKLGAVGLLPGQTGKLENLAHNVFNEGSACRVFQSGHHIPMQVCDRLIRTIKAIGLQGTAGLIFSKLSDWLFDFRYGTDTSLSVDLSVLDIQSANKARGVHYQATQVRPFRELMKRLDCPPDSVFVDFGAGKGRALMLAAEYGFKRVVGVEFSHQLCEVAKRNLATYQEQVGIDRHMVIVESDVVDYQIQDDENCWFFFNPFDATVMRRVMESILASLARAPRTVWLIYEHSASRQPVCRGVIEENRAVFIRVEQYVCCGHEFVVYSNRTRDTPPAATM